ncbi:MAG TPA: hypothetical protein VMW45_01040 [Dehalococcoidia bacterium]|nr:hypothetical protein [Dehalococcoidia bacterium]
MGSLAPALGEGATAVLGQELWQKHKEIVSGFWDSVARFFDSLDGNGFKVYQDGMVADGTEGLRIIREGIALQSKNYEIIGKLLERGATLVKTEDLALVRQEHAYITKIVGSKSLKGKEIAALRYKLAQSKLLRQRDDFIARRIKETLSEEETGILFIGAYHDVIPKLPQDIKIKEVKKAEKVREYQRLLSNPRRDKRHFEQLAQYLVSPVTLD